MRHEQQASRFSLCDRGIGVCNLFRLMCFQSLATLRLSAFFLQCEQLLFATQIAVSVKWLQRSTLSRGYCRTRIIRNCFPANSTLPIIHGFQFCIFYFFGIVEIQTIKNKNKLLLCRFRIIPVRVMLVRLVFTNSVNQTLDHSAVDTLHFICHVLNKKKNIPDEENPE